MRSTSHFDSSRFDLFRDFLVFEAVPEWTQTCDSLLSNRSLLGPSTTLGIDIYRQAEPCLVRCYSVVHRNHARYHSANAWSGRSRFKTVLFQFALGLEVCWPIHSTLGSQPQILRFVVFRWQSRFKAVVQQCLSLLWRQCISSAEKILDL